MRVEVMRDVPEMRSKKPGWNSGKRVEELLLGSARRRRKVLPMTTVNDVADLTAGDAKDPSQLILFFSRIESRLYLQHILRAKARRVDEFSAIPSRCIATPSLAGAVGRVVGRGSKKEMARVTAFTIVTMMADEKITRNLAPMMDHPSDSVCPFVAATPSHDDIGIIGEAGGPLPAIVEPATVHARAERGDLFALRHQRWHEDILPKYIESGNNDSFRRGGIVARYAGGAA